MSVKVLLAALLESLTREIKLAGKEDEFCAITVYPGNGVPLDFGPESDCRGTAWVRLVSANPTVTFPSANNGVNNCVYSLAFTVEMGMVGPGPVFTDRLGKLELPSDVEQFEASMKLADELELMHRAIKHAAADTDMLLVLGDWQPQGPDGGVLGGTWTLQIGED